MEAVCAELAHGRRPGTCSWPVFVQDAAACAAGLYAKRARPGSQVLAG